MNQLHFISTSSFYRDVLEYIYVLSKEQITDFFYIEEEKYKSFRYNEKQSKGKILIPGEIDIDVPYKGDIVKFSHIFMKDHMSNIIKLQKGSCNGSTNDVLFSKITLGNLNKDTLLEFVDDARKLVSDRIKKTKVKTEDTIRVYYYKDYWFLFNKIPKRPIDTLYLKEGELDNLITAIDEFFSEQEKEDYLSFGIPYKKVFFLYGVPGSGKTSSINALAAYFNCDVHSIPLSTDMDDTSLVDAFGSINTDSPGSDETIRKIIVIEDIDCVFEDRKEGDHLKNKITLQGLLNCMDGFTCVEGALIFITANKPESLDNAMIRSCRVDYKLELGYADEFQTYSMYQRFLPGQMEFFAKFYKKIKHKKYTTAMLQELLFHNRKCINIMNHVDEFQKIIDKNESINLDNNKTKDMSYI